MGEPEDMTIVSADLVQFHVHQACILAASTNLFNGLMPIARPHLQQLESRDGDEEVRSKDEHDLLPIINVPEPGTVISVLLFAVYNRAPIPDQLKASELSLSELRMAIASLKTYGMPVQTSVT